MSFFLYIFLFLILNRIMMFNPVIGMLLYIAIIVYFVSSNRRRWRMYSQRQQTYSQQSNYQNTQEDAYSQQDQTSDKVVKDAIDVEYSEEEIL